MSQYISCFIAIPLPERYIVQFQQMQMYLADLYPNFKLTHAQTPHITLFYIGNCDQLVLDAAADIVGDYIYLLAGASLVIHGVETFGEPVPRVLHLKGNASPAVHTFADKLHTDMADVLLLKQSLPFVPHLTLARMETEESLRMLTFYRDKINEHFDTAMFAFPLTEVVFYAKFSGKDEEGHKKILDLRF